MKFLSFLGFLLFMSCDSQTRLPKDKVNFEDIHHHSFTLITARFEVLDSQEKMNNVYAKIHQKYGGNRQAPIPTVNDDETYVIFKPTLKNSNDMEVSEVFLEKQTLKILVKPLYNPDFDKNSRFSPNILLKLHKKANIQKVTIITQK